MTKNNQFDTIIIGSGPAGLTAGIYTSRAGLKTLIIAGKFSGGQLMITSEVENFPGFPNGISGPELMMDMRKQAERFGVQVIEKDAIKVEIKEKIKKVFTEDQEYSALTVIIATGASAIWLGLENEKRLTGKGVSGCATCDGAFFREKIIAVVGGGDSALEEASFLTRFASKVYLIHRRDQFKASKFMQNKVLNNPKIQPIYNTIVTDILGDSKVSGLKLKNTIDNNENILELNGVFVAIGHRPNTDFLENQVELNDSGYISTKSGSDVLTNIEGVFVAGDVFDFKYKQAITAAGSGCKAALEAEKYLDSIQDK
jgi:thioredoxin reductase (NADPH)